MTHTKVSNHSNEGRGKIGPWDKLELLEIVCAMREIAAGLEIMLEIESDCGESPRADTIEQMRRTLIELTKGLCGTVVAEKPDVAAELASSFFYIQGSVGAGTAPASETRAVQFEPLRVTLLSTETRKHETTGHLVDVALLRVAYYDAESSGEVPSLVDALLVRRDRENDDRRVRHFPSEVNSQHFDRAVECRAQWLGVSEGPFASPRAS